MKKFFKIFLAVVLLFSIFFITPVHAADIDVNIDLEFRVDEEGSMHIREIRTIRNNSSRYYIKASSSETFIISTFKTRSKTLKEDLEKVAATIKLTDQAGGTLSPSIEVEDTQIKVKITLGSDLTQNASKTFILEYDNFALVEKAGNVWNIYVPGMPEDHNKTEITSSGATTKALYTVTLELDDTLGEPNFVLPQPATSSKSDGKTIYAFDTNTLVDQAGWIQIGKEQFYSFKITQPISISEDLKSKVFNTWYDLLLPRESESGNQKVYFESITPSPEYIREDEEGNIVARFNFSNSEYSEIIVQGYIVTTITETVEKEDVGDVSDIDLSTVYARTGEEEATLADLLASQEYWEVTAPAITDKASELKGDKQNVLEILLADYSFITENVDYDNLKTGINNQRKGALSTLLGESSVCMEYSDLLITLLRAQGIPSRAAFGYGFDPKAESKTEEGHQWVEVYMPKVGWIAVDPTWGDTGRRNYIGGDIDHALWYIAGFSIEEPSPVIKYSIAEEGELDPPKFEIQVVEDVSLESLLTLEEALLQYKQTPRHIILEKIGQLNVYGKVLFLGIPAVLLFLVAITIFISIIRLIKRRSARSYIRVKPASPVDQ